MKFNLQKHRQLRLTLILMWALTLVLVSISMIHNPNLLIAVMVGFNIGFLISLITHHFLLNSHEELQEVSFRIMHDQFNKLNKKKKAKKK